jgi:hypothetical protein
MSKRRGRALRRRYGRAAANVFTVDAGRQILRNGEPFIAITREGRTKPVTADQATHAIADCLNGFKGTYDK